MVSARMMPIEVALSVDDEWYINVDLEPKKSLLREAIRKGSVKLSSLDHEARRKHRKGDGKEVWL